MRVTGDRLWETTTSIGAGNLVLAGARNGYRPLSEVAVDGDTISLMIANAQGTEWEAGVYTWRIGGILERLELLDGSDGLNPVVFSSGTKDVVHGPLAQVLFAKDARISGNVTIGGAVSVVGAITGDLTGDVNGLVLSGTPGATLAIGAGGTLGSAAFTASGAYLPVAGTAANASQLLGATWAAPGTIGSGTPNSGSFTTLGASGAAAFGSINSTPIGSVTPSSGAFTTLSASGAASFGSINSTPIGATTPSSGSFLSLTTRNSGGAANQVRPQIILTHELAAVAGHISTVRAAGTDDVAALALFIGATEAARFTATGIKTSKLDVESASSAKLNLNNTTGGRTWQWYVHTDGFLYLSYNDATDKIKVTTAGVEITGTLGTTGAINARNNGGTASPGNPFWFGDNSAFCSMYIQQDGAGDILAGAGPGGAEKFRFSTTGLAVAGTLSATGNTTLGAGGITSGTLNIQNLTAGKTTLNIQGVAAQMFFDNSGSGNTFLDQAILHIRTYAGAAIAQFTSSGILLSAGKKVALDADPDSTYIYKNGANAVDTVINAGTVLRLQPAAITLFGDLTTQSNTGVRALINSTHASVPVGLRVLYSLTAPNNTIQEFLYCDDGSAFRAGIRSNGGIANFSANDVNLSDEEAKENFLPLEASMPELWTAHKMMRGEWERYLYKDQTHNDFNVGVRAQGLQRVFGEHAPDFVSSLVDNWNDDPYELDNRLAIHEADLNYIGHAVLSECQWRIEALTSEVARLSALAGP